MDLTQALDYIISSYRSGSFNNRIPEDDVAPDDQKHAKQVNQILDLMGVQVTVQKEALIQVRNQADALNYLSNGLKQMSEGNFLPFKKNEIRLTDPPTKELFELCLKSLEKIRASLFGLSEETQKNVALISDGSLNSRMNEAPFSGDFLDIIRKFNKILDEIINPLHEMNRVVERYVDYDYTARFSPKIQISGDWVGITGSLNLVGDKVLEAFDLINEQIKELSSNAEKANISVQEVAQNSEQVAGNSRAVSENTDRSDEGVRQVLRAMEDLAVTVGEVSQKADSVSRLSRESNELAQEGSRSARKAESGMGVITQSAGEMDRIIGEIQGEMKKINEIVRLITDIANQTNLLALNAAIEAARAGEMGRGFAVVAAEVKSLALESRQSAEKITEMISNLQKKSQDATIAVSSATTAVQDGNVMLSDTLRVFTILAGSVEEISSNIEQVASMNEEQAAAVEEIASSMHEVSAMLKETAKEAVDSASATNETSVSVRQLRTVVDQVTGITEELSVSLSKYILNR